MKHKLLLSILPLLIGGCSYKNTTFKIYVCYDNEIQTFQCAINNKIQIKPKDQNFYSFSYFADEQGDKFTDNQGNMINNFDVHRDIKIYPVYDPVYISIRIDSPISATFDSDTSDLKVKYGELMPKLPIPYAENYNFKGYEASTKNDGKTIVTNGNVYLPGYERMFADKYDIQTSRYISLTAKFVKNDLSNTKFIYFDGEKQIEKNVVTTSGSYLNDFAPKSSDNLNFAWAESSEASFDDAIFKTNNTNKTLYAIGYQFRTNSNNIYFENFNQDKLYICESNYGTNTLSLDLNSESIPQEVYISGNNLSSMKIEINSGKSSKIFVNNAKIKSNKPFVCSGNNKMEINIFGDVTIENNASSSSSQPIVYASNLDLNVYENAHLQLIGSSGYDGSNGSNGSSNSKKGGNGGNGGNGSDCLKVLNSLTLNNAGSITMIAGNGGDGGKGGKGCDGYAGFMGIGNSSAGDGGKSGNGGNGGMALSLADSTIFSCTNPLNIFLTGGSGGNAYLGGKGGNGASAFLTSVSAGNPGQEGTPGTLGKATNSTKYTFGLMKDGEKGNLINE